MKDKSAAKLFRKAQEFFDYEYRINPLTYLIAKKDGKFYSKVDISPDNSGKEVLESYAKNYLDRLRDDIEEDDLHNWDDDYPENSILFKNFDDIQGDFYRERHNFRLIDNDDFLKKQYQLRFFNIELPIDDTQSIHLHQYISSSYQSSLENAIVKLGKENEDTERIKIIDFTNSFTLNYDFDFVSFHDQDNINNCFTLISKLKPFEKLHSYVGRYKEAYNEVANFECVDLSNLADTEDCWRKCASLLKYEDRMSCMEDLKADLLSTEPTLPKDFLKEKGIKWGIVNGTPILTPENPRQLKIIIKILSDKLAQTYLRHRNGLSGHFEEFSP